MRSAFFTGTRQIQLGEMPDRDPNADEAVVDVTAVGVCGSDLHNYLLGNVGGVSASEPLVLGHEAAGVVVAVGKNARDSLRVGQRVAIDPATPCLHCEFCEHGQHHLCLNLQFMGYFPQHGALRERMTHPARCLVPVPESISDIGAAMLEPLGVSLHAIRLAHIQVGEDVLVIGAGAIGLTIIRLARLAGARRIIAVDRYGWRLDMAANFGASHLINTDQTPVLEEVRRITNKRGPDVALEAAWVTDTAQQCIDAVRHGGRVVIVGIPAEDNITINASSWRRKEVRVDYSRRMNHTYAAAIALAEGGQVDVDALATHRFPLAETQAAFEVAGTYQQGVVRSVILPQAK
ncbi:MAG: sorbitol dehydrogenase [Anaerolineae bacterium]